MVGDTWVPRDLPVLQAVVELYDRDNEAEVFDIVQATSFDEETVHRALLALSRQPFFQELTVYGEKHVDYIGPPTGAALRAAGQWPTPDSLLQSLIEGLEAAADDESHPEEQRNKLKQAASWLGSFGYQVAVGALGGAGGNMLTGG